MVTTTTTPRTTAGRTSNGGRGSARARGPENTTREAKYDLLTAAIIGIALGIGTSLLISERRRVAPMGRMALKYGKKGAVGAGRLGMAGARATAAGLGTIRDELPLEEIADAIRGQASDARDAIAEMVEQEAKDLRRAIKRQRRRLGI